MKSHIDGNEQAVFKKIFGCLLLMTYAFINLDIFNVLGKTLMMDLTLNPTQLATISAFGLYSNLLATLVFGVILDRFNAIFIVVFIILVQLAAILLFALGPSVLSLIIYRISTGILVGVTIPGCIRIASMIMPNNLGCVCGLYGLAAMLGGVLAQNPVVYSLQHFGLKITFFYLFVIGLVMLLFFLINTCHINMQTQPVVMKRIVYSAISNLDNWLAAIFVSMLNIPISLLGDLWGLLYLECIHQLDTSISAAITSMLFLGYIIGALLFGWLFDKKNHIKPILLIGAAYTFIAAIAMAELANLAPSYLFGLFLSIGLASGTQVIIYANIAKSNVKQAVATSTSILSFITVLVSAISQHVSGVFLKNIDVHYAATRQELLAYKNIIWIIAVCAFLGLLTAFMFNFKQQRVE